MEKQLIETVTVMTDDLDKTTRTNVETVRFALDGTDYEMELGAVNRRKLDAIFRQYIPHARRASARTHATGTRRGNRTPARKPAAYTNTEVRDWAKARGIPVKDRGRIPADLVDQYHAWKQTQAA